MEGFARDLNVYLTKRGRVDLAQSDAHQLPIEGSSAGSAVARSPAAMWGRERGRRGRHGSAGRHTEQVGRSRPQILPVRQQVGADYRNGPRTASTRSFRVRCDAAGLDVWLILCQEDDPDPLFKTMIPMDTLVAHPVDAGFRRRGRSVRRYNICGTNTKDLYERLYDGQLEEKQWPRLVELLEARDPRDDRDQHRQRRLGGRRAHAVSLPQASREASGEISTRASCPRKQRRCDGRAR